MNKIEKTFFIIYFSLCANLFNLFNLNNTTLGKIINYTNHFVLFILIICMCFYSFLYKKKGLVKSFKWSVIFFIVMVLAISFVSYFTYNENSLFYMSKEIINYMVIIVYFPICRILTQKSDWLYVIEQVVNIATLYSIILIIQSFLFGTFGRSFLFLNVADQTLLNSSTSLLFGFWRLNQAADFAFFALVLIFSADLVFPNDDINKKYLIQILILVFTILIVSQTRGYYLLLLTIILVRKIFKSTQKFKNRIKLIIYYLSFPILLIVIYFTTNNLLNAGNRGENISVRMSEILYYSQHWLDNGWFGIGIGTAPNLMYQIILSGPQSIYNFQTGKLSNAYSPTDIGILGFLAIFGLVGLLFLIFFLLNIIKYFYFSGLQPGAFVIFVVILGSFITLSIFNVQRIIYIGIYLSFLDYIYSYNQSRNDILYYT